MTFLINPYAYRTPASVAGVAPTLDYRFALDKSVIDAVSLVNKLTYTGATNGTFVDQNGIIQLASTNSPRFTHDPVTLQSLGLLMEPSRTNLFRQSEFANNSFNTLSGATASLNNSSSPRNTQTAMRVTATNNVPSVRQAISGSSAIYSYSVFVKYVSGTGRFTLNQESPPFLGNYDIDLLTTTAYTKYLNNWIRVGFTFSSSAVPGNINMLDYTDGLVANGDVLLLWGAQVEQGSGVSSYIPTGSTSIMRTGDSCVIDGTGVITGNYTLVEKPVGCAIISNGNIALQTGYTIARVMVFPALLTADQITAVRSVM